MVDGERSVDSFEISHVVHLTFDVLRTAIFTNEVRIVQVVTVTPDLGFGQLIKE